VFVATGHFSAGESEVESVVAFEQRWRAHLVRRRVLLFDSRYAVATPAQREIATIYLLLEGSLLSFDGARYEGPCAFVLAEDEFERVQESSRTFRSWGDPATVVDVCVPLVELGVVPGLAHGPRELGPAAWAAARLVADCSPDQKRRAFASLVRELARARVLADDIADDVVSEAPEHLEQLWEAFARLYRTHDTSAYVDLIATLVGRSPRQLHRDVRELAERVGLHGFRDTVRVIRLRRAVLLLSSPSLGVSDVARIVGYGSADAMGRAFRDAGLPPPSVVRSRVSYPGA
jgi:AraC-like DNA-binding protein